MCSPRPPPRITTPSPEPPTLAAVTEGKTAADRSEVLEAFCLMNHEGRGGPQAVAACAVLATGPRMTTTTTPHPPFPPVHGPARRIASPAQEHRRRVGRSSRWTE